jgi:hypothetical protein
MTHRDHPPDLISAYSGRFFTECVQCGDALGEPGTWHAIHKLIVAEEVVFEASLCGRCYCALGEQCSKESVTEIRKFVEQSLEVIRRMESFVEWLDEPIDDFAAETAEAHPTYVRLRDERLNRCGFCGRLRHECRRYTIDLTCSSQEICVDAAMGISPGGPLLTCLHCEAELNARLSKTTRDLWDRFVEENFGGPPELSEELDGQYLGAGASPW